jgi:tight adherence protein B
VSAVLAAVVTVAILTGRGPGGRRASTLLPAPAPAARPGRGRSREAWAWLRSRGAGAGRPGDLAGVVTAVASQLRAGADPGHAWAQVLGRPIGADGTPDLHDLVGAGSTSPAVASQAAAVIAAGRLASVLGAPLAQVLDQVAGALVSAAEADGERRAALAGPRATARVLTGLPMLGVVLGAAVGANPVGVLFGGGVGTVALLAGVGLLLIGRWWISRLVRVAARAGQQA